MRSRLTFVVVLAAIVAGCMSPEERLESYLEKARDYYEQGDYKKSRLEAMNAAQIEPKNAGVRMLLADLAMVNGEFRDAFMNAQIALETDPDMLEAHLMLGTFAFFAQDLEQTLQHTQAAEALAPGDARVFLLKARALQLQGDTAAAMVQAGKARDIDPTYADAILFHALLLADDGQVDEALDYLAGEIARLDGPAAIGLRKFRLRLLRASGRREELEAELRALAEDVPEDEQFANSLVSLYVQEGRVDDAEQVLRGIVERSPGDFSNKLRLTEFLAVQKSPAAAEEALLTFIEMSPDSMRLRLSLANLYESEGRVDEALARYRELAEVDSLDDDVMSARNRIAAINLQRGDADAARVMIDEILADQPNNVEALLARGAFDFVDGNYDQVIADARVAVREQPENVDALLLQARAHERKGDDVLAEDAYRRVLTIAPRNSDAITRLADLMTRRGDMAEAEQLLQARLGKSPDDPAALRALLRTLLEKGDRAGIEEMLPQLAAIDDPTGETDYLVGQALAAARAERRGARRVPGVAREGPALARGARGADRPAARVRAHRPGAGCARGVRRRVSRQRVCAAAARPRACTGRRYGRGGAGLRGRHRRAAGHGRRLPGARVTLRGRRRGACRSPAPRF